jgi:endoglucanase
MWPHKRSEAMKKRFSQNFGIGPSVFGLVMLAILLISPWRMHCCGAGNAPATQPGMTDPFDQNHRLGRGVNVIGYDPLWKDMAKARFKAEHFKIIHDGGFTHVRINLHPFRDAGPGEGHGDHPIGEKYLHTLDWAVDAALANSLMVVLDFHEFQVMSDDPQANHDRYLAAWGQIAEHCKDRPNSVLFEALNEPHGKLTPQLWNQYFREALAVIRKSNPARTVIVGPGFWNGIDHLPELDLPEDERNLIVTVHYYRPMSFTHQGAPWTNQKDKLGISWDGTTKDHEELDRYFDKAQAWAQAHNRPIYLGEFGAYDKAVMPARARYANAVARAAESRGWSWAWWQFDGDFVLYDIRNGHWVQPIHDALIPASPISLPQAR